MVNNDFYNLVAKDDEGKAVSMSKYQGFVLLIINVASKCSYTDSNYKKLSEILDKYYDRGLRILLFPCNQFLKQEPDDVCKIKDNIQEKYKMDKFVFFEKSDVNGKDENEVFKYLKTEKKGFLNTTAIKWNFTKFLVDKEGNVLNRYSSGSFPKNEELEKLLN